MNMFQSLELNRIVNPYYASRRQPSATTTKSSTPTKPPIRFARLPLAPKNASPVPHLTSLYHFDRAGEYGDRSYPGNCGGNLIKDLLLYFRSTKVFDLMSGSGTCRDVCRELNIECVSNDIHQGFDLCDPANFHGESRRFDRRTFDFVWLHPPYWRQKLYANDPRDLSRTPTLDAFLERYAMAIAHAAFVLKPGGKLAILMGDYCDYSEGFVPLTHHTKRIAFDCGLRQCCTDIVRFSHGASSSKKVYKSSFIPGLHDICSIFTKPESTTNS